MTRRIIQWILRIAIGFFLLLVVSAAGTFLYVYINRAEIISRVSDTINQSISGEMVMGKISVDFLHYFPGTAIHISNVSVRDSLFSEHKMEFFRAADVYVKINFMELFSPEPPLEEITIHDGSVYIFRDSAGYSNKYLLQSKHQGNNSGFKSWLHEINLKNFRFVFNDRSHNRYHNIFIENLNCGINNGPEQIDLALKSEGKIKMLGFNLKKGAYARDATFNNNLIIYYHKKDSILDVPEHSFYLNNELVIASARLHLGDSAFFNAGINAPRILFADAIQLVTPKTERLLSKFKIRRPLKIQVHLSGSLLPGSKPLVNATLVTAANVIAYKEYTFMQCGLQAYFTNQADSMKEVSAANTSFVIKNFSGNWKGIPVNAGSVNFFNFPYPSLHTTIHGSFPLRDLNKLPGGGLYTFSKGTADYKALITAVSDSISWTPDFEWNVTVQNGTLSYEPRAMSFSEINAGVFIKNYDVYIRHASCRSGTSLLSLQGKAPGILNTDIKDIKATQLEWEIKSSYINLEDFTEFLGNRKKITGARNPDKTEFGKHLERYMDVCALQMKLDIDALRFDKFTATGLSGKVHLNENNWSLESIRFNHAHGSVKLSGSLLPAGENLQAVSIQTTLQHMNISEVFTAFDNFSQQTITSSQINGTMDADVKLDFNINNKASISQSSILGTVDLSIRDGELKGFQPLGKLSKFLFRKRDFSDIRFSEITNSFVARGNEIYFDRMKINTSVMELYMEGSYSLDGKTDMRFQVPLSNLKYRDWSELSENITDHGDKGMNVYIHAKTDEQGELRFRYDPLKKLKDKRSRR